MSFKFHTTALAVALCAVAAHAQTRVQILHTSDLEGGVDAIGDAPRFAAIVEALEADAASNSVVSLLLSAGDNYIPGPFFSAAGARSLRDVFRNVLAQPDAREGDGRIDISIMNILGFDASAVGNHEFDAGPDTFSGIIGTDIRGGTQARWLGAQFPYLSSNLDFSNEGALSGLFTSQILDSTAFRSELSDLAAAAAAPKLANAAIVTRGSEQFGIVGGTTPFVDNISSTGNVQVRNPGAGSNDMSLLAQIIQPQIDALTNAGVDKIVVVTHLQQFNLEQQLIGFLRDVDVVISGGSDTLLADGDDILRPGDTATGNYPFVTTNADGNPALLVSTAGQYSYVGRLVVDFDANGVIVPGSIVQSESGQYATDAAGVTRVFGANDPFAVGTDAELVQQLTNEVSSIVIARDANIVGRSDVFLEGRREQVRTEQTNFGDLTADANLAYAQSVDATVLVSHKNGGGIRNPIGSIDGNTGALGPNLANPLSGKQAGEISQLDIENTLRFNNGLTLLTLTRDQLKDVLENAVSDSLPGSTPGRFGQFGGLNFSYDVTQPVGSRVRYAALTDLSVADPVFVENGVVLGSAPVRIVTLNFLADGNDGYAFDQYVAANPALANRVDLATPIQTGAATFADDGTEQDALAEYLLANFSATAFGDEEDSVEFDNRVQRIGTRPQFFVQGSGNTGTDLTFVIASAPANVFGAVVLGDRGGQEKIFAGFGSVEFGVGSGFGTNLGVLPLGMTSQFGSAVATFPVLGPSFSQVRLTGQAFTFDASNVDAFFATTNVVSFPIGD